jgi:hypothetical protein
MIILTAIIGFVIFMMALALFLQAIMYIITKVERLLWIRKFKANNCRWTYLDNYYPKLDEEEKEIDGEFYKEGKYFIVRTDLCFVTTERKSLVRWVSRYAATKHQYVKVFSSDDIRGKLVYSRLHARNYINYFKYDDEDF